MALADRAFERALEHLDRARAIIDVELASVRQNRFGFVAIIDAHRAIAIAELGDAARADGILTPIEPFLIATDDDSVCTRCRDAIARARA
jgi:hypothetical protein